MTYLEVIPSQNKTVNLNQVYLSIGGNLGDRKENLAKAVRLIEEEVGSVKAISALYQTKAWGIEDQPDFLNQCLIVDTTLRPKEVLRIVLEIENKMGRVRERKWYTRLIDIDLLFYNKLIIKEKHLTLPHPFIQDRNFVLAPLMEIAPDFIHPVLTKNVRQLYEECPDKLEVTQLIF